MRSRRLSVLLAGALAVGAGAAWIASDFRPVAHSPQTCQPLVAYAVDCQEDQATVDLQFEPGGRYLVIIGSLASHEQTSNVTLTAQPIPKVERLPLRRVASVSSAIPPAFRTSWKPLALGELNPSAVVSSRASLRKRAFHLHVTDGPLNDPRQYVTVDSRVVAEGRFVRVFLDDQMRPGQLANGLAAEIVRLFDTEIVPTSRRVLGEFRDVDGDGKFAILISPWLSRLQGGRTSLGGFVRGSDFRAEVAAPFGNQSDVLFLNANVQPGPHLQTLLAHEFAHAICFSERLPTPQHPSGLPDDEDWLNEAIAHVAENLHGGGWTNLDHRVSRFLDRPENFPLVVENYYAADLWRSAGCRGATYLFLRWVVDQFGPEVLARLIQNPERGTRNLETATGVSFAELFRGWMIAVAQAGQGKSEGEAAFPPSPGEYSSINLCGPLGRWGLAGARTSSWDVGQGSQDFFLRGTTAKIFEVRSESAGTFRLNVRSEGQPKLQVTIIRQPENQPSLTATASWQPGASSSSNEPPALWVRMVSEAARDLHWVQVSVECRQGSHHQSLCLGRNQLPPLARERANEDSVQEVLLPLPSRLFPNPSARTENAPEEWQLKIVAEDAAGRRVTHWLELPPPPATSPSHPPLAESQERRVF